MNSIIENKKDRIEAILDLMKTPVTLKQIAEGMGKPHGSYKKAIKELTPEYIKQVATIRQGNGVDAALYQAHKFEYLGADGANRINFEDPVIPGAVTYKMNDKAGKERYARNKPIRDDALKKKPFYGTSGATLNVNV
jgi:fructose/tagatose bisphosphate aldolase